MPTEEHTAHTHMYRSHEKADFTFNGYCPCGWFSDDSYPDRPKAKAEADLHVARAYRGSKP